MRTRGTRAGTVYADERNLDGLLSLKRDMELHGPPVNSLVYSMVLSGVFAATHDLAAVLEQWNAMLQVRGGKRGQGLGGAGDG